MPVATQSTNPNPVTLYFDFGQWDALRTEIDTRFGEGFANPDFVFRGECRRFESVLPLIDRLIPSESRDSYETAGRLAAEVHAMVRFGQHASMYLSPIEQGMLQEGLQAQIVMRHYGAPTRLLDWSLSPWIALWFACEDVARPPSELPGDGRILALKRSSLEYQVRTEHGDESQAHSEIMVSEVGGSVPKLLLPEFVSVASDWVVCYHRHAERFPRLIAQQGLFTLASKPWLDHWQTACTLCPNPGDCVEIIIKHALKPTVMRRLAIMGITAASLFPDVAGVAREVEAFACIYNRP